MVTSCSYRVRAQISLSGHSHAIDLHSRVEWRGRGSLDSRGFWDAHRWALATEDNQVRLAFHATKFLFQIGNLLLVVLFLLSQLVVLSLARPSRTFKLMNFLLPIYDLVLGLHSYWFLLLSCLDLLDNHFCLLLQMTLQLTNRLVGSGQLLE